MIFILAAHATVRNLNNKSPKTRKFGGRIRCMPSRFPGRRKLALVIAECRTQFDGAVRMAKSFLRRSRRRDNSRHQERPCRRPILPFLTSPIVLLLQTYGG